MSLPQAAAVPAKGLLPCRCHQQSCPGTSLARPCCPSRVTCSWHSPAPTNHPGGWQHTQAPAAAWSWLPWQSPGNPQQQGQESLLAGSGRGPGPAGALGWHCPACSGISVNTAMQRWLHCCSSSFPHFSKKPFIKGKKPQTPNQREREC